MFDARRVGGARRNSSWPWISTIASARRASGWRFRWRSRICCEHFAARADARRRAGLGRAHRSGDRAARRAPRRTAHRGKAAATKFRARRPAPPCSTACARWGSTRCPGTTTRATSWRAPNSCARWAASDLADWPDFSREALARDLAWLEPFLGGITRRSQLARVPLLDALRARLNYEQQRKLDELAPTHIGLPTGSRARIDYRSDNAPMASMRMQEVFGLAATPRIGGGAVPVTFELLSPGAPAAAGDARPRQFLAQCLRRGAQGHARPLPAALLARRSAAGRAHAARQAARLSRKIALRSAQLTTHDKAAREST